MMRMKNHTLWRLAIGVSIFLLFSPLSSAISVKSHDRKSKHKLEEKDTTLPANHDQSSEQISERQGIHSEDDDQSFLDPTLHSRELVKRAQNVSETKPNGKSRRKEKEHSPPIIDVIPPSELGVEENSDEDGEQLAKADLNRESRGDKNPRLYYDDTAPRFPHHSSEGESPFEHTSPEAKQKEGKLYFPKNYVNNKYSPGGKKGNRPSFTGTSGKRIPDHVHFDEGGHPAHEYTTGHGHSHHHPVIGHHEEHELADDSPYTHGIEEHTGKGHHPNHHVSGYGYHHHHGSYRHTTLSDKVDAVGKALQVLIPSALLITGVSALFPNRVHVPTTPNKYRQKRSVFRRRVGGRGMMPPPPLMSMPAAHIPPELEDIPSHILRAEHRIMDGNPSEMYTEYGKRYGTSSENSGGFDPFKVFKGPGPETTVNRIQNTIPLLFPNLPDMTQSNERSNEYGQGFHSVHFNEGDSPPLTSYSPRGPPSPEIVPPEPTKPQRIIPQISPATTNLGEDYGVENNVNIDQQRQNILYRRRKTTRKPPVFIKETPKVPVQHSSESQKSQYLVKHVKNTLDDSKQVNQDKAEQEFMSTLQNLVTPDVAKAIVENKNEPPPKEVDLSPDGPVMGLLTSYAQHENDTPSCQKRALCELAVKGKSPKSTKFEAFLWSVATLVPDVFSEMYDLQEVFQAIRNERCIRFECANPNLDIQM